MSDLLAALAVLGSATVSELVVALKLDLTQVQHIIHEALDQGVIAIANDRPDAYALPRR